MLSTKFTFTKRQSASQIKSILIPFVLSLSIVLLSLLSVQANAQTDEAKLERALYNLPNVTFQKISAPKDPYLKYSLMIKQPLDHQHPENGFFYQYAILQHRGFSNSTIMNTNGYWIDTRITELTPMFDANELSIEYRFFGKSIPGTIPWKYLTIEQATADLHYINTLFREIYKGKWISTGISKGGETTIYYKYYYPQDVDLAIPYVAPLDNALEDKRIYHFFDTVGTADCRNKLLQFQVFLLQHEKEAVEKLKWYSVGKNIHFNYTGSIGKSFEYSVLEYPFSFWQYYGDCNSIPTNKDLDSYLTSLLKISDIESFSDEGIERFTAHYYQAATQSGYYGYNIAPLKKYLRHFSENPSAIFPPKNIALPQYDPGLNESVSHWLDEKGNDIVYIYGSLDTWTAAGIIVSDKVNSERFIVPYGTHATARVGNMPPEMQQQFAQKVKEITGEQIRINNRF